MNIFIVISAVIQRKCHLLKLVPDDDRQIHPNRQMPPIHEDVTVINRLFRLIVSFRWRPLINNNTFQKEVSQWLQEATPQVGLSELNAHYPPNFILFGLSTTLFLY